MLVLHCRTRRTHPSVSTAASLLAKSNPTHKNPEPGPELGPDTLAPDLSHGAFETQGPPVGTEAHQGRKRMHRGRRAEARKQEKVGEGMGASIEEWFERMLEKK
mmetsp:Transcript_46085/g.108134  ORF Transcript_46085/g.108134 Transcript_46085/m.108134 type:complete len:104 (+) Transcript_46085:513-824(+)